MCVCACVYVYVCACVYVVEIMMCTHTCMSIRTVIVRICAGKGDGSCLKGKGLKMAAGK